jgi:glycosyltransferase involved in cell wall biosynthesis
MIRHRPPPSARLTISDWTMARTDFRLLHIMASRAAGGAETYSGDVILSLHREGIDQCVVMPRHAPRFEEMRQAGIRLAPWVLDIPFAPLQRLAMTMLMRRERPDILHCWMRRAAQLVPGSFVRRLPVIGWFGGYYNPRRFRRCEHFVGVTRDIAAHMVKNGVPPERAHYIPTFPDIADLPPIDRAELDTPKDAKVLLTLSRLHPKKGLDIFLQALQALPDCVAWLAGDGPLRRELEDQAASLGLADRVRFLGWRTDRAALLRAADICVLPSRYEPFGTVILEAWAAKTPFVACKSAGPAAHVEDGINGLLVEIDDAPGLAAALRRVLDDATLRRELVENGYSTYSAGYTPEAVTRQWLDFYGSLL